MESRNLIFIVGPTASGKSAVAINIAKRFNGEIVCADSRTIYKGLNVSTAKPSQKEQNEVVHWGLDLVYPNERFSAANFKKYAMDKILDIQNRGKLPIVVGGTGLYIDGVLFDYKFGPEVNEKVRAELELLHIEELQERIRNAGIGMPENSKNKRYLIRAIEQGGVNKQKAQALKGSLVIGLNPPKEILYERIEKRANSMLQNGALEEAKWLFDVYGRDAPAASAPFFKAYYPHFENNKELTTCLAMDITLNKKLAKRQNTWFKRNEHIVWLESTNAVNEFIQKNMG